MLDAFGLPVTRIPRIFTARVITKANISVPDATNTVINWDTDDFDPFGMHDVDNFTHRLVAPISGKYFVETTIEYDSNPTGHRQVRIVNSASIILARVVLGANGSGATAISVSTVADLAAKDWVQVIVYQDSTVALNLAGGNKFIHAMMSYLGA